MPNDKPSRKESDLQYPGHAECLDLLTDAPIGMFTTTLEGRFLFVNAVLAKWLGYASFRELKDLITDIGGQLYADPEERKRIKQLLVENGEVLNHEFRALCRNGEVIWACMNARMFSDQNGKACIHGFVTDVTGRKRIEEALRSSEECYRLLSDVTMEGIAIHRHGLLKDLNTSLAKMLGYAREELLGKNIVELAIHEDDRKIVLANIGKDYARPYVIRGVKKNGEIFFAELEARNFTMQGEMLRVAAVRDITERMRFKEDLRESEEFLNSIIENIPNMIFVKDAQTLEFVRFNKAGEDLVGSNRKDLLGKNDYDFFPREQADSYVEKDREALANGRLVDIPEERIQTRCRGERILHTKKIPIMGRDKKTKYLLGISEDITESRLAEAALRTSEEKYRELFENVPVGIFQTTARGRYLSINPEYARIVGYASPSAMMNQVTDIAAQLYVRPEDRERYKNHLQEHGHVRNYEAELKRRNGQSFWVSMNTIVHHDPDGEVVYSGFLTDITERKRAEQEDLLNYQRTQALLRLGQMTRATLKEITNFALEQAVTLTRSKIGYLAFLNEDESVMTVHSWSESAMRACKIADKPILYPVAATGLWGEALRQRRPVITNDYHAASPWKKGYPEDHIQVFRHMNVPVFSDNRIVIVAGVGNKEGEYAESDVQQITLIMQAMWVLIKRKQDEEAVRLNESRLESLLRISQHPSENIPNLLDFALNEAVALTGSEIGYIFLYDEDRMELTLNTWSREVKKRCAAKGPQSVFSLRDTGLWGEAIRQKRPIMINDFNAPGLRKKGLPPGHPPLHTYLTIPIVSQGRIMAVVGVANKPDAYNESDIRQLTLMMDAVWMIVQRKKADEERERLQMQLLQAQKMESIGTLAGGVAHDFNNLLQAMSGNVQLLLANKQQDHPDVRRLHTIAKSIDRSARLVQQLLIFSRKAEVQRQRVDLNHEVRETARILERTIPRMVRIELRLDEQLWPVHADPAQIELVLLNLGSNAAHAMPDGGRLVVETRNVILDEGFVRRHSWSRPGGHVLLSVTDTGCGMDKSTLEHIFDPFFTTKEVGLGTGLGLASVYGIVRSHDGLILCSSEPGQGTTFKIYLPAAPKPEGTVDAAAHEGKSAHVGSGTILVVDDEEVIRDVTREALEGSGYAVIGAASGEEALVVYAGKGQTVDMVILDLNMPGMGGRRCLEQLLEINPEIRVLIVSGYSSAGQAREISHGAAGFLGKPYQLAELLSKVRGVLEGAKPPDGASPSATI
ncbi:MAG TPA: PAS domain S-box protein [Desulfonatronum sp.]|nr:PAS domain S-box protein [Desulfonatronum sp.]